MDDSFDNDEIFGGDIYESSNVQFAGGASTYAPQFFQQPQGHDARGTNRAIEALKDKLAVSESNVRKLKELVEGEFGKARDWESAYRKLEQTYTELRRKIAWTEEQTKSHPQPKEGPESKAREAMLAVKVAEQHLDNLELRKALPMARISLDPHIAQVRQLLLDPTVTRESKRLRGLLTERDVTIKQLKEKEEIRHFILNTPEGQLLLARCKAVSDENDAWFVREKGLQEQQELVKARSYAEEMRRLYKELQEHAALLQEESEELSIQVFQMKRQVRDLEKKEDRPMATPGSTERWGVADDMVVGRAGGAGVPLGVLVAPEAPHVWIKGPEFPVALTENQRSSGYGDT
eukprot:jgi/Botrbrau1/1607/Bobra.0185s0022.1